MNLQDLVIRSAQQRPEAVAIKSAEVSLTYGALDGLANRFARALTGLGVLPGDRVGIWLDKSAAALAAMQGVLRLQAIYVPLDPLSPAARIGMILHDCDVKALVTTRRRAEMTLTPEADLQHIACLCLDGRPGSGWDQLMTLSTEPLEPSPADASEIAYILYTSGSTGKPKGVCISHQNALAFIEWAKETLQATSADRLANHAPFHFDISVLDLYVAFASGAAVLLIPDGGSYIPTGLVAFVKDEAPTIWYSVPSALILMMDKGEFLDLASLSLRAILFAGEPFPLKHLRRLYLRWPQVRLLNLYGPTETNVCTCYEVTKINSDQTQPVPIGQACSGDRIWAQKEDGDVARAGEEGELVVAGPTVMIGYWGQARQGDKPYATGDIVRLQNDGNYVYVGRRDHMVKVRGYRVELGDIETALETHPDIHETAVVVHGSGIDARLVAFVVSATGTRPTLLEIKRHCAERLPRYMIVDAVRFLPALPRTRNGKIDRLKLAGSDISNPRTGDK